MLSVISSEDQVCWNTRYDRMFGALLWLFSPAWDAVKHTLFSFVVIHHTDSGATIMLAQALCLTIFKLSSTPNTCLLTDVHNASVLRVAPVSASACPI